MDLRGAVALVTSGNDGLGQRTCHALAKRGVHIGVMYAQSPRPGRGCRPPVGLKSSKSTPLRLGAMSPTLSQSRGWSAISPPGLAGWTSSSTAQRTTSDLQVRGQPPRMPVDSASPSDIIAELRSNLG